MNVLNLAHWAITETVNGPGRRFTVWAQGCPHRCPGCFNPSLRDTAVRHSLEPAALAGKLAAAGPVDGITLSGGEPFVQASALAEFLETVRTLEAKRLTVVAFSGYSAEELQAGSAAWRRLLGHVDLLVDGPYRVDMATATPLAGSANQRRLALTGAGAELLEQAASGPAGQVEVQITSGGELLVSGFPSPELLRALRGDTPED